MALRGGEGEGALLFRSPHAWVRLAPGPPPGPLQAPSSGPSGRWQARFSAWGLCSQPGWDENRKRSPVPAGCRLPLCPAMEVAAPEGPESLTNGC